MVWWGTDSLQVGVAAAIKSRGTSAVHLPARTSPTLPICRQPPLWGAQSVPSDKPQEHAERRAYRSASGRYRGLYSEPKGKIETGGVPSTRSARNLASAPASSRKGRAIGHLGC